MDTKACSRCSTVLALESFPLNPRMRGGHDSQCYDCRRARARESYYRNRDAKLPDGKLTYRAKAERVYDDAGQLLAKVCLDCGEMKVADAFGLNQRLADGRATYCKPCHNARGHASREKVGGSRRYHLKRRYDITPEEVDAMVEAQGGRCAACRINEPKHVDHDHETGEVRGILCFTCNVALGNVGDDLARLQGLAAYLLRAEGRIVSVLQLECPRPAPTDVRALLRDETPRWTVASPVG